MADSDENDRMQRVVDARMRLRARFEAAAFILEVRQELEKEYPTPSER